MQESDPDRCYMPNQFANPCNWRSHYETTGPEIYAQTNGAVGVFVAGMGATGTLMGVSRYLKQRNPDIRIIGVEPTPGHAIQGLKNMPVSMVPEIYEPSRLDEVMTVENEPAFAMTRRLATAEGIFVGVDARGNHPSGRTHTGTGRNRTSRRPISPACTPRNASAASASRGICPNLRCAPASVLRRGETKEAPEPSKPTKPRFALCERIAHALQRICLHGGLPVVRGGGGSAVRLLAFSGAHACARIRAAGCFLRRTRLQAYRNRMCRSATRRVFEQ